MNNLPLLPTEKNFTVFDYTGQDFDQSKKIVLQVVRSPNFLIQKTQTISNFIFLTSYHKHKSDVQYLHQRKMYGAMAARTTEELIITTIKCMLVGCLLYPVTSFFY